MIHSVSDSLLINAMPRQVFEAVADPRKPFLTSNLITHLEVVGSQQSGKGTIYHWRFTLPFGIRFQLDEVVAKWIEPERFGYRAISGWKMEATNQITPENGQTGSHFICDTRYQAFRIDSSQHGSSDWVSAGRFKTSNGESNLQHKKTNR